MTPDQNPPPLPRPPVPGWMWLLCGLGLIPVCALGLLACASGPNANPGGAALGGAFLGLFLGLPMIGGLALAGRFFNGNGARLAMALAFACLLVVGLGGVAFAGCMCLLSGQTFH